MKIDVKIHISSAEPQLTFWQKVYDSPVSLFPMISAIVAIFGVVISVVIFAYTQRVQYLIKRAETLQKLIEWFAGVRKSDEGIKQLSNALIYDLPWSFDLGDLRTAKEHSLARLLSALNHMAFYVELGLVSKKDIAYAEAGYYFATVLMHKDIEKYMNHLANHDKGMSLPEDSSFYYLRKYGLSISKINDFKPSKDGLNPSVAWKILPIIRKTAKEIT